MGADPDLVRSFLNRQIVPSFLDYWEISGLDPISLQRDRMPAYYDMFDTSGGVIVAHGNQRLWDSQKALPWSEIMYQTWPLAAQKANKLAAGKNHPPGGPISNLRSVVQHVIHNKGTQTVMKAAYEANGFDPGYDGPEEWRKWTEEDNKPFFFAFLGTDNVKGTIWLLNDHANEIGRKEISVIWTRWHLGNPDICNYYFPNVKAPSVHQIKFQLNKNPNMQLFYHDNKPGDCRLRHHSDKDYSPTRLRSLGLLFYTFPPQSPSSAAQIEALAETRSYANRDDITISPGPMGPAYEINLLQFYTEHMHEDEEIRYILAGAGYFDVRDEEDRWVRIRVEQGDLLILPAGIYHRFTVDEGNYIHAVRFFKSQPKWTALYRGEETENNEVRQEYLEARGHVFPA
ncbi:MAG: hypothetical protein Q9186_005889 [Xanthomendoza sp. 1 TL-2023]